jgi:hypothetical protein
MIRTVGRGVFEKKIPEKFSYRIPWDYAFVCSGFKSD